MIPASSTATFVTSVDEVDAKMSRRLLSRVGELTSCISPSESSMSASPTSTDDGAGPGQFTSPHTTRLSVQLAMSDATHLRIYSAFLSSFTCQTELDYLQQREVLILSATAVEDQRTVRVFSVT